MSTPLPPPPEPGAIACPRCASPIRRDQAWCLVCGAAARTRLAPAPNWKLPLAALAGIVAVCLVALAIAFVALTNDPEPATGATGPTGATAPAPAPAAAPAPAPAPTGPTGPAAVPGPTGPSGATGARPRLRSGTRTRSGATGAAGATGATGA